MNWRLSTLAWGGRGAGREVVFPPEGVGVCGGQVILIWLNIWKNKMAALEAF